MKITANEEYGLRIILRIAKILQDKDRLVSLNEIAEAEGISVENTAAILSKLREGSLVESVRGKYGGYKLARRPEEINVYQIMLALTKNTFDIDFCHSHTGNKDTCVHNTDCSVRPVWSNLTALINNFLSSISLESLLKNECQTERGIQENLKMLQEVTGADLRRLG